MHLLSAILAALALLSATPIHAENLSQHTVSRKEDPLAKTRSVFRDKCSSEAKEEIFQTAENVTGFLRIDEYEPGRKFVGGITIHHNLFGGESNTHPHWMFFRLGLDFIEYDLLQTERDKSNMRYGRFDVHTRNSKIVNAISSNHGVRFKSIATAAEEAMGIRGRQIEVFEIPSGKILAVRKEFFGRDPDFSKSAATGVCPPLQPGQATPTSFLSRVINPASYGCWHKTEHYEATFATSKERLQKIQDCEREYFEKKRNSSDFSSPNVDTE